jgi:hypothetical protein
LQKHVLMPPTVSASIKTPTQIMCARRFQCVVEARGLPLVLAHMVRSVNRGYANAAARAVSNAEPVFVSAGRSDLSQIRPSWRCYLYACRQAVLHAAFLSETRTADRMLTRYKAALFLWIWAGRRGANLRRRRRQGGSDEDVQRKGLASLTNTVHRPGFADEAMSTSKSIAVAY